MKLRRILTILVLLLVVAALAVPGGAQDQKIATMIFEQELDNLNPMYTDMWFSFITRELWLQGLITFDDQLNPVADLAAEVPSTENGGVSADGLTITYKLREGLVWSDGDPLTSADVLFTYEMIMSDANLPTSRYPYDTAGITSVEAPDDLTVVVTFAEPYAPWLATLFTYVLPEHILRPVFDSEGTIDNADWNRAPTVGVGPFVFQEWEPGSHILFVRNDNDALGAPVLDGVFIRFVPDAAAAVASLVSGEGDIGTFIAYGDMGQLEAAGINVIMTPSGYNEAWFMNLDPATAHPAMLDVRVREALALAFNRQEIVDTLLEGRTYVAGTYWEGMAYDNPAVEAPPYDPVRAAELLDEAGWVDSNGNGIRDKDGVELELRYLTPPRQVRMDTQVIVQQDLAEVGISVILENPSYDIFWNSYGDGGPISTGQYDIGQWSQNPSFPDPSTSVFMCSEIPTDASPEGANDTRYCDPEVDALFQEQSRTVDFAARQAIFFEIAEKMADDFVWLGVWYDPDYWAVNSRIVNARLSGATPFWNIVEWDVQ